MKPRIKNIDNCPQIKQSNKLIIKNKCDKINIFVLFELEMRKEWDILLYIFQNISKITEEHKLIIKNMPVKYKKELIPYLL
jgi:hypothetical protein